MLLTLIGSATCLALCFLPWLAGPKWLSGDRVHVSGLVVAHHCDGGKGLGSTAYIKIVVGMNKAIVPEEHCSDIVPVKVYGVTGTVVRLTEIRSPCVIRDKTRFDILILLYE